VLISHYECVPGVEIDMPAGSALPPDGSWISEGIVKKAAKYGEEKAVCDLVLLIGVNGFSFARRWRRCAVVGESRRVDVLGILLRA